MGNEGGRRADHHSEGDGDDGIVNRPQHRGREDHARDWFEEGRQRVERMIDDGNLVRDQFDDRGDREDGESGVRAQEAERIAEGHDAQAHGETDGE